MNEGKGFPYEFGYQDQSNLGLASLSNIRWRVDVVLSSGVLSKVMKPSILIQVILNFELYI